MTCAGLESNSLIPRNTKMENEDCSRSSKPSWKAAVNYKGFGFAVESKSKLVCVGCYRNASVA